MSFNSDSSEKGSAAPQGRTSAIDKSTASTQQDGVAPASEGLSVLVLDVKGFGGQAGASARIENYLGFPTGISGHVLVSRAFEQAVKFGATACMRQCLDI